MAYGDAGDDDDEDDDADNDDNDYDNDRDNDDDDDGDDDDGIILSAFVSRGEAGMGRRGGKREAAVTVRGERR